MTDPNDLDPHAEATGEPSPMRVALGFFLIPLAMVVVAIAVFISFGMIAHETKSPIDYLSEINGRGINEPWQAAFHLSQQLSVDDSLHGDGNFARQIALSLDRARHSDPRLRRFLTLAIGQVGHESAIDGLIETTRDEDAEVRMNSVWALGKIGSHKAAPAVAEALRDADTAVRTMAGYVLGVIGDRRTLTALEVALNDSSIAVRMNAAVALGMMGSTSGIDTLAQMTDRTYLQAVPDLSPQEEQRMMLAAIQALGNVRTGAAKSSLTALLSEDPDLKVREAARTALATSGTNRTKQEVANPTQP